MAELNNKLILDCVEIYTGDYPAEKQYAACILLKMELKEKKYRELMEVVRESLGFRVNNRSDSAVLAWAKKVKKAGRCEICGSYDNLEAHHIIPWQYSVTGRTDVSNGQCLCKECHKMMHNDIAWIDYMRGKQYGDE
jgi:hypothetical protein